MKRSELEAAAAAAGLRLARPALTDILPRTRCTPAEKETAEALAAARNMSLSEHVRSRVTMPLTRDEIEAARARNKVPR